MTTITKKTYLGLLALFAVLYVLRMSGLLRPAFVADHASNFYLTGALVLIVGYVPLVRSGFTRRRLLLGLLPFALLNVVVELFLDSRVLEKAGVPVGRFNTADPLDLVGGLLALVVVAVVVLITAGPRGGGSGDVPGPH
jgi:hypothetical protein